MADGTLLLRGGTVVGPNSRARVDVQIVDGRIAQVGPDLEGAGLNIDAGGLHLLPGVLDAHHHQWEEGLASEADFRDDTASAAAGGITTILDHPLTPPEILGPRQFVDKARLGEQTSHVDFALHAGASPDRLESMRDLWDLGATGFKMFTCDTGVAMRGFTRPAERREFFARIAALGAIALVHAEDQDILDENRRRLDPHPASVGMAYQAWRSADAELSAAREAISVATNAGARLYLVHTSVPAVVDLVTEARARGADVHVETCPHYLVFSDRDLVERGMWIATAPPVRDAASRHRLRMQTRTDIDVVGSDHGNVLPERKIIADLFRAQAGVPGNETMVAILLDLAISGVMPLERVVALTATNPAAIFGIDDRKGAIAPGIDGDLTLVDLEGETIPHAASMVGVAGWTPYEGMRLRGRVVQTIVRGTVVARDGQPIREPGFGRLIRRKAGPLASPSEVSSNA